MIGSELATHAGYLLDKAHDELALPSHLSRMLQQLAPAYIKAFGVPEIGMQNRIRHVVRVLPNDVGSLVDIGSGAGMLLGEVHRRKKYRRLVGIEPDSRSARIARETHNYAEIICDSVQDVSDYQGCFDFAVTVDVMEHVKDEQLDPFLRSCARLLKVGGKLIVHVPNVVHTRVLKRFDTWGHHDHAREGFSFQQLTGLLSTAGFRTEKSVKTFNRTAAFAWELNMLVGAKPQQAIVFPLLMVLTRLADRFPTTHHNGILCVAQKVSN